MNGQTSLFNTAEAQAERHERNHNQVMRELKHANAIRQGRARLKRAIAARYVKLSEAIAEPTDLTKNAALSEMLCSQQRWGITRARKFCQRVCIGEAKTIGSMTERQRKLVITELERMGL